MQTQVQTSRDRIVQLLDDALSNLVIATHINKRDALLDETYTEELEATMGKLMAVAYTARGE